MRSILFRSVSTRINPFDSKEMAKHYDRPNSLYNGYIRHVTDLLKIKSPVEAALDIACGTGISTHALKPIAKRIIGIDASEHMLAHAKQDPQIEYKRAAAEFLPFPDKSFDLVSICVAFHWVDQAKFLQQAARVLRDNGHLVIFTTKYRGIDTPQYGDWLKNVFYKKYPLVAGQRDYLPEKNRSDDFLSSLDKHYSEFVDMDIKELAHLLMSLSGVFLAVETRHEKREDIEKWLLQELNPFFAKHNKVSCRIDPSIWCLTRTLRLESTHSNAQSDNPGRLVCKL